MGTVFKGSEIVQLAIRIEQNGYAFYNEFQKALDHEGARKTIAYLAEQEKKHEATFTGMLSEVEDYAPPEAFKEDYDMYMQALAESHIFSNDDTVEKIARNPASMDEALSIGMSFEKDSILFFQQMLDFVPQSQHQAIRHLIDEEKGHLAKLVELKKAGADG